MIITIDPDISQIIGSFHFALLTPLTHVAVCGLLTTTSWMTETDSFQAFLIYSSEGIPFMKQKMRWTNRAMDSQSWGPRFESILVAPVVPLLGKAFYSDCLVPLKGLRVDVLNSVQTWNVTPGGDGFIPCKTKVGMFTAWNKSVSAPAQMPCLNAALVLPRRSINIDTLKSAAFTQSRKTKSTSRKSHVIQPFFFFSKLSGTGLSRDSYWVYVAVTGYTWMLWGLRPAVFRENCLAYVAHTGRLSGKVWPWHK